VIVCAVGSPPKVCRHLQERPHESAIHTENLVADA
jgi:hypothetical protein